MEDYQHHIDSLLQRYLSLLDEYTKLRTQLSNLQASVFRDIARANFSAERGLRYGQDHYDERMQALRTVRIETREEDGVPAFEIVEGSEAIPTQAEEEEDGSAEKPNEENDETVQDEDFKKKPNSKDPLRWFGLLTPQSLRTAQASSIEAISTIIPHLLSVNAEMAQVEIEVRRARKKRAKAEAASGKDGVVAATTSSEIQAA